MVGGIAVDMMRYENERIRLQGAADRAVLAATTIRDSSYAPGSPTPEQLARSYFEAEGFGSYLGDRLQIIETEGGRRVRAQPQGQVRSLFMPLLGVNALELSLLSEAVDTAPETFEIVMVLDISNSMRHRTSSGLRRIEELRASGSEFVEMMFEALPEGSLSLTIVPYSRTVELPAGFSNHFTNITNPGATHACFDFEIWDEVRGSIDTPVNRFSCSLDSVRTTRPMISDMETARDAIENLDRNGDTPSILRSAWAVCSSTPACGLPSTT